MKTDTSVAAPNMPPLKRKPDFDSAESLTGTPSTPPQHQPFFERLAQVGEGLLLHKRNGDILTLPKELTAKSIKSNYPQAINASML